jgi:hypothetical protein
VISVVPDFSVRDRLIGAFTAGSRGAVETFVDEQSGAYISLVRFEVFTAVTKKNGDF